MLLKKITLEEFHFLKGETRVLAEDGRGQKVLETSDNRIIKLFRLKRIFSSALFYPYAVRFLKNSLLLLKLDIPTISIEAIYDVPEIKRQAVIYSKLPGSVLRDALKEMPLESREMILERLAEFIARLHAKGIFFRSVHFGNVVILPTGEFALIDISDLRCYSRALHLWQRLRNFRHLCRYREDAGALRDFGWERFVDNYLAHSDMGRQGRRITRALLKRIPKSAS